MQSDTIKTCREKYPTFKVTSPSSLHCHYSKYIINTSSGSCVEIVKASLCHYLKATYREITHNKVTSTQISHFTCPLHSKPKYEQWVTLLNVPVEKFTFSICYSRVDHPTFTIDGVIPKFILCDCTNGTCTNYSPSKIDIDICPILNNHTRLI